jgi:hypothetical protein
VAGERRHAAKAGRRRLPEKARREKALGGGWQGKAPGEGRREMALAGGRREKASGEKAGGRRLPAEAGRRRLLERRPAGEGSRREGLRRMPDNCFV